MLPAEKLSHAQTVLAICNACRYCEGYCPVFPAIENRTVFLEHDINYLANLCHNCGECLYACPFAPPHEFSLNVPRVLAEARVASYEEYCWPPLLNGSFRRRPIRTAAILATICVAAFFIGAAFTAGDRLRPATSEGDFYQVVPHKVMIGLFGGLGLFLLTAMLIAAIRFWRDIARTPLPAGSRPSMLTSMARALVDVFTLRHMHSAGADCLEAEETRRPWRRWFHHLTFYGFLLCLASTTSAAVYHHFFDWPAPYPYLSLPVVLGTAGGIGLVIGPIGQFILRERRDPALGDPMQRGFDLAFIALLLLTSVSGLALLALRETPAMPSLLLVHLGIVLALFLTLPYGRFVHAVYRTVALVRNAQESPRDSQSR